MILPFMPEGSHAILLNYMVAIGVARTGTEQHGSHTRRSTKCDSCSWVMEAELWRHMRHVHKLYYQVWHGSDFVGGVAGRDTAVLVQLPRLGYLVRVALDAMNSR